MIGPALRFSMISHGLTIRRALLLVVVFGMLVPALIINGYSWFKRFNDDIKKQTQTLLQMHAEILANGMQEPLWNINQEGGTTLINAMMGNSEDIILIRVKDSTLGVFVSREHPERRSGYTASLIDKPVIHLGNTIGSIEIEVGSQRLRKLMIETLITQMAGLAAQIGFSIALILIILEQRLVAPLQRLGKGAERLANRELDVPFTWTNLDEIGLLSSRLEDTRISLRRLFAELDEKNQELELDIEKRKRVEQELHEREERFRVLVEQCPIAIIEWDKFYRVVGWNESATKIFGYTRAQAMGQHCSFLSVPKATHNRFHKLIEIVKDIGATNAISENMRVDEHVIICQWNHTYIHNDIEQNTGRLLSMAEDITEQRRAEDEIRQLNATLEERVVERTNELQKTNEELATTVETLNVAQEELVRSEKLAALGSLVAGIAHELNTPIGNSLMVASTLVDQTRVFNESYAQGLKRSTLETYLSDASKAGDILIRNLDRAASLVTSFKQVAVDQTSSQRRRFSLAEVLSEIMTTLWPTLKKTAYKVDHQIPEEIVLDSYPGPLGQVITNLINNAMIHGFEDREEGNITLVGQKADEGWIEFIIKDDGVGIPPENLTRIFDPFFTTKLGAGGSGLGLNITHNIVTGILGGRIRVHSEINVGTSFIMTLPVNAPQKQTAEESAQLNQTDQTDQTDTLSSSENTAELNNN